VTIFVLGMHRSGTSLVARILTELGVHIGGSDELLSTDKSNLGGYNELKDAVELNKKFEQVNRVDWRTLPTIGEIADVTGVDDYAQGIAAIAEACRERKIKAIKDPRISLLFPYWRANFKSVEAIICVRRPAAVAQSLAKRNNLPESYTYALWESYTLGALRNTRRVSRALVTYESLLASPVEQIKALVSAIPSLKKMKITKAAIKAAAATVIKDLDHSESADAVLLEPEHVRRLYDQLVGGDMSVSDKDGTGRFSLEMIRREALHQNAKATIASLKGQKETSEARMARLEDGVKRRDEVIAAIVDRFGVADEPVSAAQSDAGEAMLERLKLVPLAARQRQGADGGSGEALKAQLEDMRQYAEERVGRYRAELERAEQRAAARLDRLSELEDADARARAGLEASRLKHDEALAFIADLKERMRTAEAARAQSLLELGAKAQDVRELKGNLEDRTSDLARITTELTAGGARIEALQGELEEKSSRITALSSELKTERAARAELYETSRAQNAQVESLTSELAERRAAHAALSKQAEDQTARLDALSDELAAKANSIETLSAKLAAERRARAHLGVRDTEHAARIEALMADLDEQSQKEQSLPAQLEAERQARAQAEQDGGDQAARPGGEAAPNEARIAALAAKLDEAVASTFKLSGDLEEVREERDAARSQLSELRAAIDAQASKLESQRANGALDKSAESLRAARVQELEGENVRAESALRQKDEFANQLEDEIDRVKAEAERDREAADSKVNGLVQSLNSLTKQLEAADRKLAALDKEEIDERQLNQLTYEAWSDIVQYTEVLDKLLAPRLGRFAVPVRSVRQQLIGLRNVALKGRHAVSKRLRAR